VLSIALSSRKVAAALAERLQAFAPEGVTVSADGHTLVVQAGELRWDASGAPATLDDPKGWAPGEEAVLLESVAYSVLSGVQDAICEATAESWPQQPEDPNALPEPGSRVERGQLLLWFGNPAAPVLVLDHVRVADLA
jgi:hypothetical protein